MPGQGETTNPPRIAHANPFGESTLLSITDCALALASGSELTSRSRGLALAGPADMDPLWGALK